VPAITPTTGVTADWKCGRYKAAMFSPRARLLPLTTSLVALLPALVFGACIPGFDPLAFGRECDGDRDCADAEECDHHEGKCVSIEDDEDNNGGEGEGEGDPPPDPQGPQFLQLSTNISTVRDSDTVIFTAVLTDPDGIDDIIGGSLVNPGNEASYGSFQTSAAEGSYELSVSWGEINLVAPIDFASPASRPFTARFFDVAGHVSEKTVQLTLTCDGAPACDGSCGGLRCGDGTCTFETSGVDQNGNGMCGNTCRDLTTASDCGGCGNSCNRDCLIVEDGGAVGGVCTCLAGDCTTGDVCMGNLFTGTTSSVCQAGDARLDNFGNALLDAFGGTYNLCSVSASEAQLLCAKAGQTGGVPATSSSTQGFDVDCSGVSSLADCVYRYQDTCVSSTVTCGSTPPPPDPDGDFTCTAGTAVVGTQVGTLSGASTRDTCSGPGPDDAWVFVAPFSGLFGFDTLLTSPSFDSTIEVRSGDCVSSTSLGCNDQAAGGNLSEVQVSLTSGQRVLVIVDEFTGSGSFNYTLRVRQL
jgi:hypothetical protein